METPAVPPKCGGSGFTQIKKRPVTYIEILWFVWWSLMVMIKQLWQDIWERHNGFSTPFTSDILSHFFFIPAARIDPRLVLSGPHDRMRVLLVPPKTTRRYEELATLNRFPTKQLINCASNNYGGFSDLEYGSSDLIEKSLVKLPFAPGLQSLEEAVRFQCTKFMGFEACETTPSGFSSNVLAFRTLFRTANAQGRKCIFLCDSDCHNSMFTGAYNNKKATTIKFRHSDLTDLEFKLRVNKQNDPHALICVAIEGIYSLEGSIPPIPAILALKSMYRFTLLVDEAHSFMALGSEGKGSFNYWQDLGYDCQLRQADIMTCMFSKSVACTGGMVLANREFAQQLEVEAKELDQAGSERLSTIVLVRILNLLRKPLLIRHRMKLLKDKAIYAAGILSRAGCEVLSSPGSAIICFPVGTVRQVALFHGEALKMGVAIVGAGPPATPVWGCRVRMCIFATTRWVDIHTAMTTAISICVKNGIPGVRDIKVDDRSLLALDEAKSAMDVAIEEESATVDRLLDKLVDTLAEVHVGGATDSIGRDQEVISAGVVSMRRYGIGPCSARWFYGSFDVFVELEQRLAGLYPSLVHQGGRCRAMVCGDADVTIGSSFASRAAIPHGKDTINIVLLACSAPKFVVEAVQVAKDSPRRITRFYDSGKDIPHILAEERRKNKCSCYLTLYLQTVENDVPLALLPILGALCKLPPAELSGATVLLDDRNGLGKLGNRKLGYLEHMESLHGNSFLSEALGNRAASFQFLVAGSWYNSFGLQGGYVTGCARIVECLTWNARAYMFSTPPMPLQTVMASKAIEVLEKRIQS